MVGKELSTDTIPSVRFNTAVKEGSLRVKSPSDSYVEKVSEASGKVGDVFLSWADRQVLALALELKDTGLNPQIVTDDYSIQNVANLVGVEFTSLMTYGIRYRFYWIKYCPACHRKYRSSFQHEHCEICGTELKRRPLERRLVRKQGERPK
jgi:UPF0271 protein